MPWWLWLILALMQVQLILLFVGVQILHMTTPGYLIRRK